MPDTSKVPNEEEKLDVVDVENIEDESVEEEELVDPEVKERAQMEQIVLELLEEEKIDELLDMVWRLQKNLKDEKKLSIEYLNTAQMVQANFENYQKRIRKEQEYSNLRNKSDILQKFFTIYEDLERTTEQLDSDSELETISQAIKLIFKNLKSTFDSLGIQVIDPLGEGFDPKFHEVVYAMENNTKPVNQILEVVSKGFLIDNTVIKPARVVISKQVQVNDE